MPSKVYLMWSGEYEERYVAGVYATLEDAMQSHKHPDDWKQWTDTWNCEHVTNHKTGNVPIGQPITYETVEVPVIDGKATLPNGNIVQVPEGRKIVVPVPPPNMEWVREWTTRCDASIQEYDVLSRVPA